MVPGIEPHIIRKAKNLSNGPEAGKMTRMVAALKQVVTVQPGGVIQIRSDQLQEGSQAEVIVLVQEPARTSWTRPLTSFIGSGKGAFKSIEEVDAYIKEIRDWGERDR